VETIAIESAVVNELNALHALALRMIGGEAMNVIEFATVEEGPDSAEIATIDDGGEIYHFVVNTSKEQEIDDFLELRSGKFLEMAITLPKPLFTRFKAPTESGELC